jgi:hypothetical protein
VSEKDLRIIFSLSSGAFLLTNTKKLPFSETSKKRVFTQLYKGDDHTFN